MEPITVTVTRIQEDVSLVPADVTVISGEDMRARHAADLRSALALAPGLDIAPGSDQGPASNVPELWGFKEIDAYLLVVDGVPWGGAFNPDSATVDLRDVDRIEVIRGAAPVMYGATSFSGVIHVIHKHPADAQKSVSASYGSYHSGGASVSVPLSPTNVLQFDDERRGFSDPRTSYDRAHVNWRGEWALASGTLKLAADGVMLNQAPASPRPLNGTALGNFQGSPVPLDANNNPLGAYLNENRATFNMGFDRDFSPGTWSNLLSVNNTDESTLRGFLDPTEAAPLDAHGFSENLNMLNIYMDTHMMFSQWEQWKIVSGADYTLGRGAGKGGDFDYTVSLDGNSAPRGGDIAPGAAIHVADQRDFAGLYSFAEWRPLPRWLFEAGARLNFTGENRQTTLLQFPPGPGQFSSGSDHKNVWRGNGSGGITYTAWSDGADLLRFYGDYRNTYKPAAVDFGLDTAARILAPETAQSYEVGTKSRWFNDHLDVNASLFQMDMNNLVINTVINGLPALENAGMQRFRGFELSTGWRIMNDLRWDTSYSLHDARFRSFLTTDGNGNPIQAAGDRLPTSARSMASSGLTYSPSHGLIASAQGNYVGSRFLDEANTALAPSYITWSAGVGYRFNDNWECRLDGYNINNQRPPVSASELGTSQYYVLPARFIELSASSKF